MENTGYVALSYAVGLERKMDIVSNNIANVDTNGYRASHMIFKEHVVNASKQKPISMVEDVGNYRNFQAGPVRQTGNKLDVALQGNGFLAVSTQNGEKYTRNGAMTINNLGQLVSAEGNPYVDNGGQPITLPANTANVMIAADGTISTPEGQVGQLKIVRFEDPQQMTPVGSSLYESKQEGVPDATTTVTQGALEGSNVNAVIEMTDMIEVMRKYQSVAQILQNEHDSQINMIQKLGRAS